MRNASIAGFILMAIGAAGLFYGGALFATRPVLVAVQIGAAVLMVRARWTFGRRSFHAAADPTSGGVVSTGPYAYMRHPIYAALIYFCAAAAIDHPSWRNAAWAALVFAGACVRMSAEERLLLARYPEYDGYRRRVRRVVPFVF